MLFVYFLREKCMNMFSICGLYPMSNWMFLFMQNSLCAFSDQTRCQELVPSHMDTMVSLVYPHVIPYLSFAFLLLGLESQISFATGLGLWFFLRWPHVSALLTFPHVLARGTAQGQVESKFVDICWLYFVTPIPTTSRLFARGLSKPWFCPAQVPHSGHFIPYKNVNTRLWKSM